MRREFISFPKSGRTWLRYALVRLGVAQRIKFSHDGFAYNDRTKPPLDFNFACRMERYQGEGKFVYLHRDPRDVIVSHYFQVTERFDNIFRYKGTISEFIRDPYFGVQNLVQFQAQWNRLCDLGIAFRITYEDCHRDFTAVLGSVLDHFELTVSSKDIQRVTEESSFDRLKAIELSNLFPEPWLRLKNGAPKVRQGRIGGYRNILSAEDCAFVERLVATRWS